MSRSTQFFGHTDANREFLETCTRLGDLDTIQGMFGEEVYVLGTYRDAYGAEWDEVELDTPWAGGPTIFLGITSGESFKGWREHNRDNHPYVDYNSGDYWI